MTPHQTITHLAAILLITFAPSGLHGQEEKGEASNDALLGIWVGESMEADGEKVNEEGVKHMRFNFKADKLLIKGFSGKQDDSEQEHDYVVDTKQTPMHLDFTPPNQQEPVLAIYEVKDDKLTICMRHPNSKRGRPEKFETKEGLLLVMIVFKKQMP